MSDSTFDNIFKSVAKAVKDDGLASVHKAGDLTISSHIPYAIRSGIPELDYIINRPGWPAGRVVELFGFEHCGKTTLALHALAEAQRMGGGGYFIDTEKSWDERRARQVGLDTDLRFGIGDADSIEAVFRLIQAIVDGRLENNDGKPFVIVVDSVTGTSTEFMKKHTMGKEERVGQDARTIRGGMRRIGADLAKANITLIMINHAISTIPKFQFAKQSEAAGGHAIKLFATVRVNLAATGWHTVGPKDGPKTRVGQKVMLKIEKLKGSSMTAPQIKEILLLNTTGFDTEGNLLDAGVNAGWIDHKFKSKDYTLGDTVFPKADWHALVQEMGGVDAVYTQFLNWCQTNGTMATWG
jgi:recombination protein RecA